MSNKISEKDKKAWEEFLSNDEKLPNKDISQRNKKIIKNKYIDLHGFTLSEANKTIEDLINNSYEDGVSKIVVVTGKGLHSNVEKDPYISKDLSILKHSVPEFIYNNKELNEKIIEIKDAETKDGGSGSFYIFLKKKL
ncbi:Smr/MutS family protein [Candidatus Pelagibacter sp.]|nr:Smr/MutS family protein [Candidatus Pelagibacter sp.]